MTGFSRSVLYDLKKKAIERRYDPKVSSMIYNVHIEDAQKSGRPGISLEKQQEIVTKVTIDRYGQKKFIAEIAREVEVGSPLYSNRYVLHFT